jgi:GT2 family glycosyltransferase
MLSIIVVNYRATALIINCIESVKEYNNAFHYEIIVVDNNSNDGGQEELLNQFPEVKWLNMGYNAGFARANNAGIKQAKGNVFLLLNPDTLAVDDSIARCYFSLQQSNYIAAGVQQLDAAGAQQISGNFFVKGGLNHLLPLPYWGALIKWIGYKANVKVPNVQQAKAIEEVDWISGAFLMVKKEAIEKAGLMDEDFFLYAEEVEWCSRLKKAGPLCIFGDLHIVHLEGGAVNKDQNINQKGYYNLYDKKGLQLMVSNHLRVRKQYGIFWFLFLLINYTLGVFVFFMGSVLQRTLTLKNPFGSLNNVRAFTKNVFRLWQLVPTIIRNKPHFYKMF